MSSSLNPDQARHSVKPDLDPNCFQMLSTDDTEWQSKLSMYRYPMEPGVFDLLKLMFYVSVNKFSAMPGCFLD